MLCVKVAADHKLSTAEVQHNKLKKKNYSEHNCNPIYRNLNLNMNACKRNIEHKAFSKCFCIIILVKNILIYVQTNILSISTTYTHTHRHVEVASPWLAGY